MLRLLTRFIGVILLAGGFIALIVDGTRSIAGGELLVTPVSRGFAQLFPGVFTQFQAGVESISTLLWDPVLRVVMLAPVSLTLGGVGAALILLSHKRPAPLGYVPR